MGIKISFFICFGIIHVFCVKGFAVSGFSVAVGKQCIHHRASHTGAGSAACYQHHGIGYGRFGFIFFYINGCIGFVIVNFFAAALQQQKTYQKNN
jgi:hypothetical protein